MIEIDGDVECRSSRLASPAGISGPQLDEGQPHVTDENTLRPAIARELDMMSKGAYTVDQEGVTVDGKETDIRFRALSRYQASIELKVGEKPRSGKELRDTIETQLVKKYMAARNARTGCLLVTVANPDKRWDHPDTGESMDRHQLQEMLTEAAQLAQQRLGGDARVMARVLDLTPRLPKESSVKKASKHSGKTNPAGKPVKVDMAASNRGAAKLLTDGGPPVASDVGDRRSKRPAERIAPRCPSLRDVHPNVVGCATNVLTGCE